MSRSTHSDNHQRTSHSPATDLGELRTPGFTERLAYGCGDIASNLVFIAVASFLTFFYTDVVGIDAATVGAIFLVSRLIAAVSDLAIGIAMEKRRSRRGGKALPWLKWFAVPFGLSLALMFSAPDLDGTGKIVYAFITFNLCASVIYSAINIPYGVLATLMTKDQFGRALLNTFRMVGCYAGSIAIAAVTLPMVDAFGGGSIAWTYTFLIIGAMVTALFYVTFRFCREAVSPAAVTADDQEAPPLPVMRTLGLLAANRYWMLLLGFSVALNILLTLPGVSLYYAKWVLGDESAATGILTLRMIAELSGVLLAVPVVKRWGKRNACLLACFVITAGQLLILVDPSALTTVIIGQCVAGIGAGAILGSIFAMIGDVIEHVEWRSHIRAEGMVYSGISVGQKIGAGIGSMIIGMMLAGTGYVSSATASGQPDSAIGAIGFLFIWLPVISAVTMALLLIGYTLDRRYPRIVSDLAARRQAVGAGGDQV